MAIHVYFFYISAGALAAQIANYIACSVPDHLYTAVGQNVLFMVITYFFFLFQIIFVIYLLICL